MVPLAISIPNSVLPVLDLWTSGFPVVQSASSENNINTPPVLHAPSLDH